MRLLPLTAYALIGVIAAAATTVTLAAVGQRASTGGSKHVPTLLATNDCVVQPSTFLNTHDLGDFSVITVNTYHVFPYRGSVPGSRLPPFVTGFRAGRLTGFIANVAVHGPDRAAEDAFARSLGYHVGRWPLVPLQGAVVRDNAGLLEVYETAYVFKSVAAAKAWIESRRQSIRLDRQSQVLDLPGGGVSGVAYQSVLGPNDGAHEHVISYAQRFGKRVLAVAFQGGVALAPDMVNGYWKTASTRLAQSCAQVRMSEAKA